MKHHYRKLAARRKNMSNLDAFWDEIDNCDLYWDDINNYEPIPDFDSDGNLLTSSDDTENDEW